MDRETRRRNITLALARREAQLALAPNRARQNYRFATQAARTSTTDCKRQNTHMTSLNSFSDNCTPFTLTRSFTNLNSGLPLNPGCPVGPSSPHTKSHDGPPSAHADKTRADRGEQEFVERIGITAYTVVHLSVLLPEVTPLLQEDPLWTNT